MRSDKKLLVILIVFVYILSGCSQAGSGSENGEGREQQETSQQAQVQIDIEFLKENLMLGMTKEEVADLCGQQYEEVIDALDDLLVWRYDFPNIPEYHYTALENMDSADIEGLVDGNMRMQLFIGWGEEETVRNFSVLYTSEEDEHIYEYRIMIDGTVKESRIL